MNDASGGGEGTDNLRRVLRVSNVVLRYRWLIITLPILAGAFSVATSMRRSRTYTSTATFMTQSGSRPQAAGLAAQLGIAVGGGDPTLSPEFYADLLTSRPILERTVAAEYSVPSGDSSTRQTLVQRYGGVDNAIERARGRISTSIRQRTGVVVLSVRAESAELSREIARELLRQLDDFNLSRRKSRVGAERRFTEARLAEAAAELRAAEDALQDFYTKNRDFERSPELKFREERLSRAVSGRRALSATLAQAYEQAKIDEVRDTPVITVLEEPLLPRIGDSRNTVDRALLAMVLATLAALGFAFGREAVRKSQVDTTDELAEMQRLSGRFLTEIRHPIRSTRELLLRPQPGIDA